VTAPSRVRLGVVGLGWFGDVLADAARAAGLADVVACFARSPDTRATFARAHACREAESYEALLGAADVDAVMLATPHSTHADMIERAAGAGKHVFVEKPLALTAADAQRAVAATTAAGVVLQVGHNRRRQPANRSIATMIEQGTLGTVLHLEGTYSVPGGHKPDLPAWRRDPAECPAGSMTALGVHTVDTFAAWVGRASRVAAFTTRIAGITALDEATTVLIEYASGQLGTISTSYFTPAMNTVAAFGTERAAWNEEDGTRLFVQVRGEPSRAEQPVETIDTIEDEIVEFVRCITDGSEPETGGPAGLEVAIVLEGIVRSASSGCAVELEDIRRSILGEIV
jgi:predicted dehydrogenase